jgi:hypothetical protein
MHLLGTICVYLVTTLFFIGLAGSAVVVVITFIQEIREFNAPEDAADELRKSPPPPAAEPAQVASYTAPRAAARTSAE